LECLLQGGKALRALLELVDLQFGESVEELALYPGVGRRLYPALEDIGERAEVFDLLVEPVQSREDFRIISSLLTGLDVGIDGALGIAEVALGDLAETPPQVLRDRSIEDGRRALFERVGETPVSTGGGGETVDLAIELGVVRRLAQRSHEH